MKKFFHVFDLKIILSRLINSLTFYYKHKLLKEGDKMNYRANNERGFIPFIVGGALGYGIGSYNRPNYQFYSMYYPPIYYIPYQMYPYYRR